MTAPKLLVIQPDESDPIGPLGDWLTEAGAELDIRLPPEQGLPADLDGYAGVVCLGGGMGANDDVAHPWLADVRKLLSKAASARIPTLAICLGGQLLAVALGGGVATGDQGPEVGPGLVSKKDAAWTDPLFADLPLMQDILQFHNDAITRLPAGAELLASSPRYAYQAFRFDRCAYGVQFHIETTPDVVLDWARQSPEMAELTRPEVLTQENLARVHADITENQYQAIVKVPGSFRPAARNEHLYSYCNFAGPVVETVGKSLRHSCRSELTRQGISLP